MSCYNVRQVAYIDFLLYSVHAELALPIKILTSIAYGVKTFICTGINSKRAPPASILLTQHDVHP